MPSLTILINFVNLIFWLSVMAAILGGIILLQVFLSRKENRCHGLIMPGATFAFSLTGIFFILSGVIAIAVYIFLLFNIPTVIFLAIYKNVRKNITRRHELKKMSVQDL